MTKTPARKTRKPTATGKASRSPAKTASAARKTKKRYQATPADLSDRQHLISVLQKGTGCTAKAAKETFDDLIRTIAASLKKNRKVQLKGFGSFEVVKRPARKARNPRTGEAIRVRASRSVRFRPGQPLRRSV